MKATKKIVGAACALVAAVALSAGSTFAWFSSNGTVDAKGMEIQVSSSDAYLIIADSATNLKDEKTEITLASSAGELLPSAYWTKKTSGEGYEDLTTKAASGSGSIVDAGSWYTGKGTTSTNGALLEGSKVALNDDNFDEYVVVDEIFVAVSKGSPSVEHVYMSVNPTTSWNSTNSEDTNNSTVSVVILYQTMDADHTTTGTWNIAELSDEGNDYGAANHKFLGGDTLDLGGLEPSQNYANYIHIKLMVYFDGNNADVNTANSANLTGITLDFQFTDGSGNSGTEESGS